MNIIIEEVVSEFPIEILEEVVQISISDAVSYFDIIEVGDIDFVGKDGFVPVVDEATGKFILTEQQSDPGGGVPEAPNNANAYVRSGLAWVIGYTKTAIDTLLGGKFNNPTGNNTQYLDGAGVPTIFPTIPSPQNITQVLTEGNIAEDIEVIFTNNSDFNVVRIHSIGVLVSDSIGDYFVNIDKESILSKNNVDGTTRLIFESTTTDEEITIPNETGTAATREWTQPKLDLKADLVGGLIPSSQLPATVDEILEYANLASFPSIGVSNFYYLALDTNKTYRWSGSTYIPINEGIALGETSSTAYRGDRGKTAYDHSQDVASNPHNVNKSQVGLGNIDNTSDLNKPISTATETALNLKANIPKSLRATSNIVLTSTTASQKLFGNLGDNGDGSFNVEVGRYRIEILITLTNLATTNSSIGFLTGIGDGTSAFSNILIAVTAFKAGFTGSGTGIFTRMTSFSSNPAITSTTTNANGFAQGLGEFSVTTAGKFYPAISLNVANTAELNTNSYVTITKIR